MQRFTLEISDSVTARRLKKVMVMQTDAQEPQVEPADADVVNDVVPDSPIEVPSKPPPPKRSGVIGLVLGGAIAAAFGFALAQYVPNGWPFAATADLSTRIAAQTVQIEALQGQLAKLPKATPTDPDVLNRISALESRPHPNLSPVEGRITALESRLTAIESLPSDGSGATPAAIEALRAEVQALRDAGIGGTGQAIAAETEARLKEAQIAAAAITENAEKLAKTARQQAAVGQLQMALDSGATFGSALAELGKEIDPIPAVLADNAETGLPTLSALKTAFPPVARQALDTALRANMGQSWATRAASFLRSQTGARSLEPREGSDPDAILSRAEALLSTGDLTAALTELASLPPEAQPALADWRAMAETRIAADLAIAALAVKIGE